MNKIKNYLQLILGIIIEALAFNVFLSPNNFAASDISGLALIFNRIYGTNITIFILISNLLLIIASFLTLGKRKTLKTIFGAILLPIIIYLTEPLAQLIDLSNIDKILIAVIGGTVSGIGYGMIFKSGYTSGGTDILEDIVCKYFCLTLGKSILLIEGFIVICSGLSFGLENFIYSVIVLLMMSIFSNKKTIGISDDKIFLIRTPHQKEVINHLKNNYQYGITILDAKGAFTNKDNDIVLCSTHSKNYYKIKQEIINISPSSFIVVLDSYDTNYINKSQRKKSKQKNLNKAN